MNGPGAEASGARALDAPATRRWVRHRLLGGIAAMLLGAGLVVSGLSVRATAERPVEVGPDSRAAQATIVDVRRLTNGRLGETSHLVVTFRAEDGRRHTAEIDIGAPKPQYAVGGTVPVVYQAADPGSARLEGVPVNPSIPWVVPLALGIVAFVLGAMLLGQMRAIARTLRDNPWVMARTTLIEASADGHRPIARFLELDGAPDEEPVLAGPLSPRLVPELLPDAWVAGSERHFVVAGTGGAPLGRTQRARLRPRASSERRRVPRPQPSS
jgi:hypothetical protein